MEAPVRYDPSQEQEFRRGIEQALAELHSQSIGHAEDFYLPLVGGTLSGDVTFGNTKWLVFADSAGTSRFGFTLWSNDVLFIGARYSGTGSLAEIRFRCGANADQLVLNDGQLYPAVEADIDLGATASRFNNIFGTVLYLGKNDDTQGYIVCYGPGTGNDEGGEIRLHTGADHDTSVDYYFVDAYQDDLRFAYPSNVLMEYQRGNNAWLMYRSLWGNAGSAAFPGFSFNVDTDLGMYRYGVNQLGLKASSGVYIDTGATNDARAAGVVISSSGPSGAYPIGTLWCRTGASAGLSVYNGSSWDQIADQTA
jgi:hypothetical protein